MARRARARGRTAPDRRAGSQSGTLSALVVFVVMALSRMVRLVACSPMDVTGERARARRARKRSEWFPCSGPHGYEQSTARRCGPAQRRRTDVHDDAGCHASKAPCTNSAVSWRCSWNSFFPRRLGIAAAGAQQPPARLGAGARRWGTPRAVEAVAGTPSLRRGMPLRPVALRSRPFRRQPPIATLPWTRKAAPTLPSMSARYCVRRASSALPRQRRIFARA